MSEEERFRLLFAVGITLIVCFGLLGLTLGTYNSGYADGSRDAIDKLTGYSDVFEKGADERDGSEPIQ